MIVQKYSSEHELSVHILTFVVLHHTYLYITANVNTKSMSKMIKFLGITVNYLLCCIVSLKLISLIHLLRVTDIVEPQNDNRYRRITLLMAIALCHISSSQDSQMTERNESLYICIYSS